MDPDPQILQEKLLLLITRERELMTLRNKHQRLMYWLTLFQSLPEVVDRRFSLCEIGAKFVRKIVTSIKLQRVELLELATDGLRPFGCEQPTHPPLPADAIALIMESRSGMSNDPAGVGEQALAEALKVHRMLWYRLDALTEKTVLLVGGFDLQRASSYMPFDKEDMEHLAHAGQHFESLLSNVLLLKELERDKIHLERFNEELEERVRERTMELARANRETSDAFSALREKDRRISEDLSQACAFQQRILPTLPKSELIQFGAAYRPLDMVGGDIYDVAKIGPDQYRIFIADATGHGVQASLRTIAIKSEYDRMRHAHASPDTLLVELNQRLVDTFSETEMLCSACCFDVTVDSNGANLRYSNAAHPPLLRCSQSGIREIYQAGSFLGLSSNIELRVLEERLERGDLIVAYTDGISDQLGPNGEPFELESAIKQRAWGDQSLQQSLVDLCDCLDDFRGAIPQGDDVTLVAVRLQSLTAV